MIIMGIVLFLVTLCVIGLAVVLDICVQKIQELNKEVHKLKRVEKDIVDLGIKVSGISSRLDICEKNHMTAEDEYVKSMENVGRELIRVNNYMAKIRVEERRARNMSVFEGAKENEVNEEEN